LRIDTYHVQNDATIRLNRSIERKYKRTNNERTMITEQNPHFVPHDNTWKFKRAYLNDYTRQYATSVLSQLPIFECNSNSTIFKIPGFGCWKKTGFG